MRNLATVFITAAVIVAVGFPIWAVLIYGTLFLVSLTH